jgi:hypothetical protein
MAKAKVKRKALVDSKVPTVDLIRNQKVPKANSASGPFNSSAIAMGASSVPSADLIRSQKPDTLNQQITQEEMMLATAAMGPTEINGEDHGGTVTNSKKIKIKKKK